MKGFVSFLAVAGGVLLLMDRQIPFTAVDYSAFPGGSKVVGALLILLGLFLVRTD